MARGRTSRGGGGGGGGGSITEAMHSHVRALQNFVTGVGASEGSRPLAVQALRQALSGGTRLSLDTAGKDGINSEKSLYSDII